MIFHYYIFDYEESISVILVQRLPEWADTGHQQWQQQESPGSSQVTEETNVILEYFKARYFAGFYR